MRPLLILLLLTACGNRPPSYYEGWYYGVRNEGILNYFHRSGPCAGQSFIQANVFDGKFELSIQGHTISGTLAPDGTLHGTGTWQDDQGTVNATFDGGISGPMFGNMFSGTLHDGRCNPYLELTKPRGK